MADKNTDVSYDRNPSDVLRLLVGLVLFLFLSILARGTFQARGPQATRLPKLAPTIKSDP